MQRADSEPSSSSETLVVGIDDHPLLLRGLSAYLAACEPDVRLVAVAATVTEALDTWQPGIDVALLDIHLADGSTLEDNVARLLATGARVVILTSEHRPVVVQRALDAGAIGLVLKEDPEDRVAEAIRDAGAGRFFVSSQVAHGIVSDPRGHVRLSDREREVLGLLAKGLPWTTIGRTLRTAPDTARTYCYRAIEKYAQVGAALRGGPKEVAYRAFVDGHLDPEHGPRV